LWKEAESPRTAGPKTDKLRSLEINQENMRLYSNILDIKKKPQFGYLNHGKKYISDERRLLQEAGLAVKVPRETDDSKNSPLSVVHEKMYMGTLQRD